VTDFYLYVRTPEDAGAATEALRSEGYVSRAAPSADPESDRPWLVLASREVVGGPSMGDAEAFLRQLAEQYDGEYDGWEAAVR
jgi:Regulator of ribonuclease activity B